jgi:TonB family protein
MSPPAAGLAVLLHVAVAAFLLWAPVHKPTEDADEPIEVTMEAPPPEAKPVPEPPKPAPAPQPPPAPKAPPAPPQPAPLPGLAPRGEVGPKNMYPKLEKGHADDPPPPPPEQPPPDKPAPQELPPQQAMAQPAEPPPPPPPPPPDLEKELPPIEAPPPPVSSRDIASIAPPPVPAKRPEPTPAPTPRPQQQAQPSRPPPQPLSPSPLSRLQRNAPTQQPTEQPRSTFVNPADTYAMNTVAESYQYRVVDQVGRYQANLSGAEPTDNIVVRFTIARNGSLLSVAIVRSSGKPAIDRGLITAFQSVAPFPPLPPELPGDSATFTLAFGPRFKQR